MNRILLLLLLFFGLIGTATAQITVKISGPASGTVGQTQEFSAQFYNGTVDPNEGDLSWWTSHGDFNIQTATDCSVTWTTAGTAYLEYALATWDNYYYDYHVVSIDAAAPSAPTATAATSVTGNSFTASWNSSFNATSYQLDVSTSSDFSSVSTYNNLTVTSYQITGLTSGTTYYYRVRAVNSYGASPNSGTIQTLTLPSAPVTTYASAAMTSFEANWSSVPGATGYRLDVSADNFNTYVYNGLSVTGTSYAVSYLNSGTTYYYRVRAANSSGTSDNSDVRQVTTLTCTAAHQFSVSSGLVCYAQIVTLHAEYEQINSNYVGGEFRWYAGETDPTPTTTGQIESSSQLGSDYPVYLSATTTVWVSYYDYTTNCETSRQSHTVTFTSPPSVIQQYARACYGTGTVQLASNVSGVIFQLYKKNEQGQYQQHDTPNTSGFFVIPDFQPSDAGDVYFASVNQQGGCGQGQHYYGLDFEVLLPTPPAVTGNLALCQGNSTILTASGNAFNYRWYNSAGEQVHDDWQFATPANLAPGNTMYSVRGANSDGTCLTDPAFVTVHVDAPTNPGTLSQPAPAFAPASGTLTLSGYTGNIQKWQYKMGEADWNDINNTMVSQPFGSVQASYRVIVKNGVCNEAVSNEVTNVIEDNPAITSTGSTIAMGSSVTLSTGSGYSGYFWKNSNNTVVGNGQTFTTATKDAYTVTVTKPGVTGEGTSLTFIVNGLDGQNENYIAANVILNPGVTNESSVAALTADQNAQTIQYFDGLGRPMQTVITQGSPNKKDIVQPIVYDEFGREARKYLPIVPDTHDGWYRPSLIDPDGNYTHNFYSTPGDKVADDPRPYSETVFEPSPLNRPFKDYGAGESWSPAANNKFIAHGYHVNVYNTSDNDHEEIMCWKVDSNTGAISPCDVVANYTEPGGFYATGQLSIKRTKDEHGNEVIEYTDNQERLILKKVQVDGNGTYAQTYYVYDDLGNLVAVLPPEAVKKLEAMVNQN